MKDVLRRVAIRVLHVTAGHALEHRPRRPIAAAVWPHSLHSWLVYAGGSHLGTLMRESLVEDEAAAFTEQQAGHCDAASTPPTRVGFAFGQLPLPARYGWRTTARFGRQALS